MCMCVSLCVCVCVYDSIYVCMYLKSAYVCVCVCVLYACIRAFLPVLDSAKPHPSGSVHTVAAAARQAHARDIDS